MNITLGMSVMLRNCGMSHAKDESHSRNLSGMNLALRMSVTLGRTVAKRVSH